MEGTRGPVPVPGSMVTGHFHSLRQVVTLLFPEEETSSFVSSRGFTEQLLSPKNCTRAEDLAGRDCAVEDSWGALVQSGWDTVTVPEQPGPLGCSPRVTGRLGGREVT